MKYLVLGNSIIYIHLILLRIEIFAKKFYSRKLEIFLVCVAWVTTLHKFSKMILIEVIPKNMGFQHLYEIAMEHLIETVVYCLLIPQCICLLFALYYKLRLKKEVKKWKIK